MDLNDIRKLVRLMIGAELTELEIDDTKRGLRVYLKRRSGEVAGQGGVVQPVVHVVPGHGGPALGGAPSAEAPQPAAAASGPPPGTTVFASPMVGTFYRSPAPEADSFVEVGSQVTEDTVICIIEAMKVMNEIKAETKGTIVEILVENGEPVEFGQPLFTLKRS